MSDYSARWPYQDQSNGVFSLQSITFSVKECDIVAVVGKVGSGKSTLLMACLKELETIKGICHIQGLVAYASQEPWIQSETVRDNILVGDDFDKDRYEAVIRACALDEDINGLSEGDLTLIGERGLTLSGGQKARISLARAVYQDADIYLLDDPLSAVDCRVANRIFFECICGLLKDKLRIVVTHQLQFLSHVDRGILLCDGPFQDTSEMVREYTDSENKKDCTTQSGPLFEDNSSIAVWSLKGNERHKKDDKNDHGAVDGIVYLQYLRAGRGALTGPLFLFLLAAAMGAGVLHDWILVNWTKNRQVYSSNTTVINNALISWLNPSTIIEDTWYIKNLGILILLMLVLYILAYGRRLYNKMFIHLLKAPVYFFESNPVGQELNRFSRDTALMDLYLIMPLLYGLLDSGTCLPNMIYILIVNPWCMIPASIFIGFLLALYYTMLPGTREMRSPIYSHLSTTLDGLMVIRAMKKEKLFMKKASFLMGQHSSAWFTFVCSTRLLSLIVNVVSTILLLASYITLLADFDAANDSQASTALAFVYIPALLLYVSSGFVQSAQVAIVMTSVERIYQYSMLEQEAPDYTSIQPPSDWPSEGKISLINVSLQYRGQAISSLGPISLTIRAGEKLGVVGRTGAGKSSFFVALLRMVEPIGKILIDGINIKEIGLAQLRGCISVIPQDPVLFSGSLRHNLDPFDNFPNDEDIWAALEKVQLKTKVLELPGRMLAEMRENGNSFSVGEKQLLCLARALLRKNKVVLLDEATANVDNRTDAIIQKTLQEEFSEATVITIAHRLNTLIAVNRVMVLEGGVVVELDHPHLLLQKESGTFYKRVKAQGQENVTFFMEATKQYLDQQRKRAVSKEMSKTKLDEIQETNL